MKEADIHVFLDSVQFERRSWQCRNRVKAPTGTIWLTVPTFHNSRFSEHRICDVQIDNSKPWQRQHFNALRSCYGRAPYFKVYAPFLKKAYERNWRKLAPLDIHIIKYLAKELKLSTVFLRSSELGIKEKRSRLLLEICRKLGADRYVSSNGAEKYMGQDGAKELFRKEKITVYLLECSDTPYSQLFGKNFIPHLSFVDCLFNHGSDPSRALLDTMPTAMRRFC
jgi:hypothetical protein